MAKRTVAADPTQYSKQSLQSYGADRLKEYLDIEYSCWRCKKTDVFTAQEQKQSFEVKKNYIWQRRNLCRDCWMAANKIKKNLEHRQERWASAKTILKDDSRFLSEWLELLIKLEEYAGYRADTARKDMLKKLLSKSA